MSSPSSPPTVSPPPPPPTCSLSSLTISSPLPPPPPTTQKSIYYRAYKGEGDLKHIVSLVDDELSEPYNLYTYRYFLDTWPHLCFFAFSSNSKQEEEEEEEEEEPLGVIISKLEPHTKCSSTSLVPISSLTEEESWTSANIGGGEIVIDEETGEKKRCKMRGYLAMLSVRKDSRGKGIATHLLRLSLTTMIKPPSSNFTFNSNFPADEIVLETESDNLEALSFYSKFGFVREKELFRFYLNGKRAARLKLDLRKLLLSLSSGEGIASG
ncbi:hypothetical protein JCM5350_000879 [Sporobolomyces pararoseus]